MQAQFATPAFNAAHLRVEQDAEDWATILGGMQVPMGPVSG